MSYKKNKVKWEKEPIKSGDFPPTFKFEKKGDEIAGIIKHIGKSRKYDTPLLHIETDDGLRTVFCSIILAGIVENLQVEDAVKIVYVGDVKTEAGRYAKNYEVFRGSTDDSEDEDDEEEEEPEVKPKKKATKKKTSKKKKDKEYTKEEIEKVKEDYDVDEETAIEMLKTGV